MSLNYQGEDMQRTCYIAYLFLLALVASCSSGGGLDKALDCARTNRANIDSLLRGYGDDSLKYACAEFLIVNSANYHSVESEAIDSIEAVLAVIINTDYKGTFL